jgi:2-keto-4-pentenoate hydratase/2-oxohepta-3-ene-1,7-dioic acid hydratase in catechol pathway
MKLATCLYQGKQHLAVIEAHWQTPREGRALLLDEQAGWLAHVTSMQMLIERDHEVLPSIDNIVAATATANWVSPGDLTWLAPIPQPRRNIICLGWNYAEHARESSAATEIPIEDLPTDPIVFTKATTTVNGPFDDVPCSETVSTRLDWEVELGVVIGKGGRNIDEAQALQHVFGYTVINDISARDLQKRHKQFFLGKSLDGSCPMGPWIVTADEIADPQQLDLSCRVNDELKQSANTAQQIFPVGRVISILSRVMTLLPGDIIATGTPSGVGFARTPPEYLQPGDRVECEVERVGRIINTLV